MKKILQENKSNLILSIVLSIANAACTLLVAVLLQKVIDSALTQQMEEFRRLLFFSIFYLLFMGLMIYALGVVNNNLKNSIIRDYRKSVYQGLMNMKYNEFDAHNTADYISSLTNDMKLVEENFLIPLFTGFQYLFVFIGTCFMLFYYSWIVAVTLILSLMLMLVVPNLLGKKMQDYQDEVSSSLNQFTSKTKDLLSGFEVIKTFNIFAFARTSFSQENESVKQKKNKADNLLSLNQGLSNILGTLSQFAVIFISAYLIIEGRLSAGTMVALIQLSSAFVMPVVAVLESLPKITGIKPVVEKIDSFIGYEKEDKPAVCGFDHLITAEKVSFQYKPDQQVITELDLMIRKGRKYTILGKSGCGKTTLVKLLTGYYDTYQGEIELDGQNLQQVDLQSSSNLIAMIHQNVFMFDSSIRENITLYEDFSEEELNMAIQASGVDQFINDFPEGLASSVGENGNRLSGGQRQRIAIARALIRKTPILVVDEGTSAIDKETAREIELKLLEIPDLTLLTITHKLEEELLEKYDEIICMEDGRVSEVGGFHQLMNQKQVFHQLLTKINSSQVKAM